MSSEHDSYCDTQRMPAFGHGSDACNCSARRKTHDYDCPSLKVTGTSFGPCNCAARSILTAPSVPWAITMPGSSEARNAELLAAWEISQRECDAARDAARAKATAAVETHGRDLARIAAALGMPPKHDALTGTMRWDVVPIVAEARRITDERARLLGDAIGTSRHAVIAGQIMPIRSDATAKSYET